MVIKRIFIFHNLLLHRPISAKVAILIVYIYISVSIVAIALFVSTLISGFVSETIGPKKAMAFAQLVVFGGWMVIYFATTYEILLFSRCVMGLGIGISFPTTAMY